MRYPRRKLIKSLINFKIYFARGARATPGRWSWAAAQEEGKEFLLQRNSKKKFFFIFEFLFRRILQKKNKVISGRGIEDFAVEKFFPDPGAILKKIKSQKRENGHFGHFCENRGFTGDPLPISDLKIKNDQNGRNCKF